MADSAIPEDAGEIEKMIADGRLDVKTLADAYASKAKLFTAILEKVAAIQHPGADNKMSLARDDLESVVWTTQEATHEILYCAERIDEAVTVLSDDDKGEAEKDMARQGLAETTGKLFESCNFQDLTGQRITFITNTINDLNAAVKDLIQTVGEDAFSAIPIPEAPGADPGEMLSGPDLQKKHGISQSDIDLLFG